MTNGSCEASAALPAPLEERAMIIPLRVTTQARGQQIPIDSVCLDYEQRQRSRQRAFSAAGRELLLMLPRGTRLTHGSLLEAEDGTIIRVLAIAESLSRIEIGSQTALARAAYHLGNRHVALEVGEGYVAYQRDHVLDAMMRQLGYVVHAVLQPFCPEPGAYQHHQWERPRVVETLTAVVGA